MLLRPRTILTCFVIASLSLAFFDHGSKPLALKIDLGLLDGRQSCFEGHLQHHLVQGRALHQAFELYVLLARFLQLTCLRGLHAAIDLRPEVIAS